MAFGGTLHQRLHEIPGRHDHRRNRELPIEESTQPREHLRLTPGGALATWLGKETAVVNSLHGQGIAMLAPGLVVEALATDDTIEAIGVRDAKSFVIGVQWHVEIGAFEEPLNRAILTAFGRAVRDFAARRRVGWVADQAAD